MLSMQSSNPLIALGVSAVVVAGTIGVSPAAAEPDLQHRPSPVKSGNTPQTDTPPTDAAQSQETIVQQSPGVRQRTEDRLDRLQTESQIRQQLNQSQFRTFDRPLTPPATNSLQIEQSVQQQLNMQGGAGVSPSHSLDRLQFEQRVRQQMQRPQTEPIQQPSEPQAQAAAGQAEAPPASESVSPETTPTEHSNQPDPAAVSEPTPKPEAERIAEQVAETETAGEASSRAGTETAQEKPETAEENPPITTEAEAAETETAEAAQTETGTAETGTTEAAQTETETTEAEVETAETETAEAETAKTETTEATQAETETAETRATEETVELPDAQPTEQAEEQADEPTAEAAEAESETVETEKPETEAVEAESPEAEQAAEDQVTEDQATDNQVTEETEEDVQTTPTATDSEADRTETAQQENLNAPEESLPIPGTSERVEFGDAAETIADDTPAPEYLDPDPNPLLFPTLPEEVELVGTQPITLRQAVELAIRNNPTLRQAQFELERSQADLRRTQAAERPTLDATANFTQSGNEATSRVPETVTDQAGNEVPNPNPDAGGIVRQYNDSTALGTGLELNYSIYTSGRVPALVEAARSQVRLQQLEVERQTEQLILETIGDYYDLQQAGAQVNIFQANLNQAEQSLRDALALERAGVGTRFDVLQAEVDVANARQRLTQQLSDLEVSRRELVQRLNLSQTVNVSAADPIEVAGVWDLTLEESIVQAYKNRVELEQQLVQREIAQQNRRAALAQLGPQVGLQGAFNLNSNLDNDAALEYSYQVALVASLALYDGGEARAQADREESNISIAESEFENVRDQIRLDVERGYSQLNASFANIQTTALAVEQATEALRLARLRFQAGVGTQTDVLRQQSVLAEAQVNNLSAILDYNRSLAVLQRAISNYPEGFLNDVP